MGFIDLHVYSTASEGSLSPAELVKYACEKGLYAFALTDNGSVAGLTAAENEAKNYPVKVIPAVEITSSLGGRYIDLLGYNIDPDDPLLVKTLRTVTSYRDERNIKMCAQLRAYGVDINYEDFIEFCGSRMITRSHFASYLVACGFVSSQAEAFSSYLGRRKPCFVPMKTIPTNEAANAIRHAGGKAVAAHPGRYRMTEQNYVQFFTLLKTFGVQGIEAIHSDNSMEDEQLFKGIARDLGMFITGGSGFCGMLRPDIDMGTGKGNLMIPQDMLKSISR